MIVIPQNEINEFRYKNACIIVSIPNKAANRILSFENKNANINF